MELTALVNISYDDVFDDYDNVDIKKLIAKIPTHNAIEIISYFQAQIHVNDDDIGIQILLTDMWSTRFPPNVIKKINEFIHRHQTKNDKFLLINNASCLNLLQCIIENNNTIPSQSDLTPEQELDLFKAYLYFTKIWLDSQVLPKDKFRNEFELLKCVLPNQLPYVEILELKDFRIQFIKAIYFFKFCEQDSSFSILLDTFLRNRKVKDWQEYLFLIISSYVRDLTPGKTPSIIHLDSNFQNVADWINTLCIDTNNFKSSKDFKDIREKPIYKLDDKNYAFLNLNFFVDKIFQGIRFDFANSLIAEKSVFNGKLIDSFPEFNRIYTTFFSEKILFFNVMRYAFQNSKYSMLSEEELIEYFGDGAPDFYIRDKAKIYIFEFKDITLNSDIKHSYDFDTIKNELNTKFYQNQKGKPKGIGQLINVIKKIANGDTNGLISDKKESLIIYPVIVYTDFSINAKGIGYLMNKEFVQKTNVIPEFKGMLIKDLIMIDLDSLIKFQDLFRTGKIKLNFCLNRHIEFTHEDNWYSKLTTFNQNIHYLTSKLDYKDIEMFNSEIKKIVEKNVC